MKTIALAPLAALAVVAPAFAADFSGPRVEAHAGWDRVQAKAGYAGDSAKDHDDAFVYGGELGYDLRRGNTVFGVVAGIDGSTFKQCASDATARLCAKAGRDIELGGRIGFVVTPQTMVYGKVAYANVRTKLRYSDSAASANNFSDHDDRGGIRVGAGIEQALGRNVYAKAEYRYTDYQDYKTGIGASNARLGLSRHQVIGGVGVRF